MADPDSPVEENGPEKPLTTTGRIVTGEWMKLFETVA